MKRPDKITINIDLCPKGRLKDKHLLLNEYLISTENLEDDGGGYSAYIREPGLWQVEGYGDTADEAMYSLEEFCAKYNEA